MANERPYVVRLLIQVEGETPFDAVNAYIERLNQFGLRAWTYTVQDAETNALYHVEGDGSNTEHMTLAKFQEQ